jgi:hypothetical protein
MGGRGYYHGGGTLLHHAVWRFHRGDIPPGHDIHHCDDDPANNELGNLECLTTGDHCRLHMDRPERKAASSASFKLAVVAAAEKRRANPEWSSELSRATGLAAAERLRAQPKSQAVCAHCGNGYEVHAQFRKRGFCSPSCQGMARKKSGIDDRQFVCVECGAEFTANRYLKRTCCSRHCAGVRSARLRL